MAAPRSSHPNLILLVALACAISLLASAPLPAAEPPNIVLIFVDDMGYGDLACYGNKKIKTPNLDRLAAEGQRWTSFYSSGATCVPSRTGLMSGRHPSKVKRGQLAESRKELMAAMLKGCGYTNAILGKWHLAGYPKDFTKSPMHPLECGFDYHFGTPGSNDVPAPKGTVQNRVLFDRCEKTTFQVPLIRGREVVEFPVNQELFTQRYTAEAVKWIKEKKDQRFFLYLAHNMPHAPVFASPKFQDQSDGGRYGDVIEEIEPGVVDALAANLDLYATFASLAKGSEPKEKPGYISKDLSGVLLRNEASPRMTWFYGAAYRSGNYKIHLTTKERSSNPDTRKREPVARHDPPLLFDLSKDIGERTNIAADHPEIVDRLVAEMAEFRKSN